MALSTWLTLSQAREAVANGRPDEAHRLIEPLIADGYRKAWKVAREVVAAYIGRARQFLDLHNPDAAWGELVSAEALNTGERAVAELRQTLTRLGLVSVRAALEGGKPVEAVEIAARLRERGVRHPDLTRMEEAAQDWILAAEIADRGDFLRALSDLERVRPKLSCPLDGFDRFRGAVEARHERFRAAIGKLYEAAEARRWRDALAWAEEALNAAPEHREARTLRGKAWQAVHPSPRHEPDATELLAGPSETMPYTPAAGHGSADDAVSPVNLFASTQYPPADVDPPRSEHRDAVPGLLTPIVSHRAASGRRPPPSASAEPMPGVVGFGDPSASAGGAPPLPKRFFLWVDGVGGYLVCLSPRVTFGQATADGPVDVPLFADVSRLHAEISRDGEGYVVESAKAVLVNGKEVTRSVLSPGDRVTLGATCQFLFTRPVPVSLTARLELTSGHRLPTAVEGVILMGNELMLGPGPQAHVVMSDVKEPVLIYRSKDGLGVRVPGAAFRVDDRPFTDRAPLPLPAAVVADAFSFAVEPVGPRL
jgi:hypothetical protein